MSETYAAGNPGVVPADERHGAGLTVPRLRIVDDTPPPDMRPPASAFPTPEQPPRPTIPAGLAPQAPPGLAPTATPGYPPQRALSAAPDAAPTPWGKIILGALAAFVGGWILGRASSDGGGADADPLGNPEWEAGSLDDGAPASRRRRGPARRKPAKRKPAGRKPAEKPEAAPAEL